MTVIIDYGVGNLFSLKSSFSAIGESATVSNDPDTILSADRIILPGVGAFKDAAQKLSDQGLDKVIREAVSKGIPLLGICLGMQLLFDRSLEFGEHLGLGLIKGIVAPISSAISENLKIPHIGWNSLSLNEDKSQQPDSIFKYIKNGDHVYFVHSFYATECDTAITSLTDYGAPITASVQSKNIYGCQFHPEKSGDVGLKILKAFCEISSLSST